MTNLLKIVNYYKAGLENKCLTSLAKDDDVIKKTSYLKKLGPYKDTLSEQTKSYIIRNIDDLDYVVGIATRYPEKESLLGDLLQSVKSEIKKYAPDDIINTLKFEGYYESRPKCLKMMLKAYKFLRENNISIVSPVGKNIIRLTHHCIEFDYFALFDSINPNIIIKLSYAKDFMPISDIEGFAKAVSENEGYLWLLRYIVEQEVGFDVKDILKIKNPKKVISIFSKIKVKYKKMNNDNVLALIILHFITDKCNERNLEKFWRNITEEALSYYESRGIFYHNVVTNYKYDVLVKAAANKNVFDIMTLRGFVEKKYSFLKTLQELSDFSFEVLNNSIFSYSHIYSVSNYLNLNELSKNDIITIAQLNCNRIVSYWEQGDVLTPKEFIELIKSPLHLAPKVYQLLKGKVDDKLVTMKQLANIKFDIKNYEESEITNIFNKLNKKNLYKRIDDMPVKITPDLMLKLLSLSNEYDHLINQAINELELEFIYRNRESIDINGELSQIMRNFIIEDKDCVTLLELLEVDKDFLDKYKDTIEDFCIKGNASIAVKYYYHSNSDRKKALLRIVKADMMGELEDFKFYNISKEIETSITTEQESVWKHNDTFFPTKNYKIFDTYSFKDTMLIGEQPTHTCMSYIDGGYSQCLLANFDSNKKILYVKKNGLIVARAIIRLTKAIPNNANVSNKLSFADYDEEKVNIDEELILFLERPYFGHVSDSEEEKIKEYMCAFVKSKCDDMGIKFIACDKYTKCELNKTQMKIFITHTKNDVQYMDSLGGESSYRSEAHYVSCTCYM